jgi:hypothetical protein
MGKAEVEGVGQCDVASEKLPNNKRHKSQKRDQDPKHGEYDSRRTPIQELTYQLQELRVAS